MTTRAVETKKTSIKTSSKRYRRKKRSAKGYSLERTELIGLEAIQDLIELALWTAYIMGERIVSLLIVAPPESGKTELMKKYRKNKGIHVRRRFTACGLIKELTAGNLSLLFDRPKILGFIFQYDFRNTLTFKANTVEGNIEFLSAATEEGLSKESAYWISGKELGPYENLKVGLIAGINTFGFFTSSRKVRPYLHKGGWFSRNIVVTFSNSEVMDSKISNSIARGEYRYNKNLRKTITLKFPKKRVQVYIPKRYSQEVMTLASEIAEEYSEDLKPHKLKGFRLHKSLISLVKASALRDGRKIVEKRDIERIRYLSQWMNLRMNKLRMSYPFA